MKPAVLEVDRDRKIRCPVKRCNVVDYLVERDIAVPGVPA